MNLHGGFESTHQVIGIKRSQQSGHIFDTNRVRSEILQFFGQIHKPIDAMDRADCIADRGFGMFPAGLHFTHGSIKIPYVIQRVKDAEDVNAVRRRSLDEPFHDIVGVMAIADQILAP
jgi:hypothetical protein